MRPTAIGGGALCSDIRAIWRRQTNDIQKEAETSQQLHMNLISKSATEPTCGEAHELHRDLGRSATEAQPGLELEVEIEFEFEFDLELDHRVRVWHFESGFEFEFEFRVFPGLKLQRSAVDTLL